MKNKRLLDIFGEIDDRHIAEAAPVAKKSRNKPIWFRWGTIAACMVLVLSVCFGSFAVVAEAKEYKAAVQFFNDYGICLLYTSFRHVPDRDISLPCVPNTCPATVSASFCSLKSPWHTTFYPPSEVQSKGAYGAISRPDAPQRI